MIVQRQNSAYDRTDSIFSFYKGACSVLKYRGNHFLNAIPATLSVLTGGVFIFILFLLLFAQHAFAFAFDNRSLLSNLALLPIVLAFLALLLFLNALYQKRSASRLTPDHGLWFIRLFFVVTLALALIIARSTWYYPGWDASVVHAAAAQLARGIPVTSGDYFRLCPNNAPIAMLLAVPLWVGVQFGLAVPYVLLPYIDAFVMTLTCYLCVLCVRKLTQNRLARNFSLVFSAIWIALTFYVIYPYTDTYAILFPTIALYVSLSRLRSFPKWALISALCFFGVSIKPTVLIFLIALMLLGVARVLARHDWSARTLKRLGVIVFALLLGAIPAKVWQDGSTAFLAGSAKPQGQLSETHYLMLGMNGKTYGGHTMDDVEFSQSFPTLAARRSANLQRAWERLTERSLGANLRFFSIKAYKAYADGSFAANASIHELSVPKRTDALSLFLRTIYHKNGNLNKPYNTVLQAIWLGVLMLCAYAMFSLRKNPVVALLALTLLGLTAYLLLFEVWPRYLFLYAPFFVILSSLGLDALSTRLTSPPLS